MSRTGIATFCVLVVFTFTAQAARAADQGEIALVEDDGSIQQVILLPDASLAAAAKIFYKSHSDRYHDLFFFWSSSGAGIQQGWTVFNDTKGIGRDNMWNQRTRFGVPANGMLRMAVKMGSLPTLPENPDDRAVIVPGYPLTGAELMGHEFGHHWLAAITYKQNGVTHCWVRGFEPNGEGTPGDCDGYEEGDFNQHWSYDFNSRSVMYGSFIGDNGGGQFTFTYPAAGYSPLDQYLMGLRPRGEVEADQELFVVDTGSVSGTASLPMQHSSSTSVTGTRADFSMDDVIASMGERIPQSDPCHRKAAFLLIHPKGQPPTAAAVAKMDKYRKRWETYYDWATSSHGSVDTTLSGSGPGTATCPSGAPPDGGFPDAGSDSSDPSDQSDVSDLPADAGSPPEDGAAPGGHDAPAGTPDGGGGGTKPDLAGSQDESGGCSCSAVGF
ncbi:MAG: hypothetical protein HY897_04015 [Deltaproteobacteria bacterium]|nr:hypothetical protein [Deltaproteobacteria bacterium]